MDDVKKILVVCRMVRFCSKVVHYGVSLASKYGSEVIVMNVIHDPFGIEGWSLPLPSLAEDYRRLFEKTKKELEEIIAREKTHGTPIRELIREGKPVDEILRVIREEKIDLLLLPAHEETRIERFIFGDDNQEIMHKMPCSIMLVKRGPDIHHSV